MDRRLPTATRLVYDNYNALAIGYSATARASDGVFSIAVYPALGQLVLLAGGRARRSGGLLAGNGNQVRHIVLRDVNDLESAGHSPADAAGARRSRIRRCLPPADRR